MMYIIMTVVGFLIGNLIQLISMPLVYMFQNYIEKVLMLLTRLSEKEARSEMAYFIKFQQ